MPKRILQLNFRLMNWFDITKPQLEKFIGINIIMGYCKNLSMESYWSTDGSFRNERISMSIPCNTFKEILGNLHLVDNLQVVKKRKNWRLTRCTKYQISSRYWSTIFRNILIWVKSWQLTKWCSPLSNIRLYF